jgi:hypothetical protein
MKLFGLIILGLSLFSFTFAQEARKIDEFSHEISCEDYLARIDSVVSTASANPTSKIFMFIYEGKTRKYKYNTSGDVIGKTDSLPQFGLVKVRIQSIKKLLAFLSVPIAIPSPILSQIKKQKN